MHLDRGFAVAPAELLGNLGVLIPRLHHVQQPLLLRIQRTSKFMKQIFGNSQLFRIGWTQWFLSWTGLLKGSATGKAVEAGPSGSKLVDPSSLAADQASSPVGRASAGNYLAG